MAKTSTGWKIWLALALGAIVTWQAGRYLFTSAPRPDRLINQLWIERMPTSRRDMVWQFVAIEQGEHRNGILGRASHWRLAIDVFHWKQEGDGFSLHTPQNDCRLQVKARTWKCAGQAPKPFELCLEIESGGKHYRYFSREDWQVRPGAGLPADAAWAAPAVLTARQAVAPQEAAASADLSPAGECPALGPGE
jgi:hypothetical protein